MDRIRLLQQFAVEDPKDPFNFYVLALEYLKVDVGEALPLFENLVSSFPEYLPTYYPYAQLLAERKDHAGAEKVFIKGIEIAEKNGEQKTLKELKSAYQDFQYG